ncbi:MAG: hypothetical protein ACD_79C00496G0010 [uncultured bacterium]|nr:MAG: hypothetical protein ACD_79C00496G0010 [uncultured bacterium]
MNEKNILLISVGGNEDVVIHSIVSNKPEKIIFFASVDSREKISKQIIPAVFTKLEIIPDYEIVVTDNHQDVGECAFCLLREIPVRLKKMGLKDLQWPNLIDYTAGTKSMSSAVVWASSKFPCKLCYIGSQNKEGRTKDGLGIVKSGAEREIIFYNPWNKVAFYELSKAGSLFNRGQYKNAVQIIENVEAQIDTEENKRFFHILKGIFEGYACWDNFQHKKALDDYFKRYMQSFIDIAKIKENVHPGLIRFAEQTHVLKEHLEINLNKNELSWEKIYDLLANAIRRANLEKKYEDATARLYSCVEKYSEHALTVRYGINSSRTRPEQIPDKLREEFIRRYKVIKISEKGTEEILKFGLQAKFQLLIEFGDEVGKRFKSVQTELEECLEMRNKSILAHGIIPINEEKFTRFLHVVMNLFDLKPEDLIYFPVFPE